MPERERRCSAHCQASDVACLSVWIQALFCFARDCLRVYTDDVLKWLYDESRSISVIFREILCLLLDKNSSKNLFQDTYQQNEISFKINSANETKKNRPTLIFQVQTREDSTLAFTSRDSSAREALRRTSQERDTSSSLSRKNFIPRRSALARRRRKDRNYQDSWNI